MGILVQIKDVPEETHRILKSRAALGGVSMSEYLRAMLVRAAARPTPEELTARIAGRERVELPEPSEVIVRRIRDEYA